MRTTKIISNAFHGTTPLPNPDNIKRDTIKFFHFQRNLISQCYAQIGRGVVTPT